MTICSSDSTITQTWGNKAWNWWFSVLYYYAVSTCQPLLNTCRCGISHQVYCIDNVSFCTEWWQYYPGRMLDITLINHHIWKRYGVSVHFAHQKYHSPITILFHRQMLLKRTRIYKKSIVRSSTFAILYFTCNKHTQKNLRMLSSDEITLIPIIPQSSPNSAFTSTSWMPQRNKADQKASGIWLQLWKSKLLWCYN